MEITQVTPKEFESYDNYVTAHSSGSFLQSRVWGDFQTSQGNKVVRYLIQERGHITGTAQLLQKTAPKINQTYLYCPYGPLTQAGTDLTLFLEKLKQDFPKAILLRFEPKDELNISGQPTIRTQPAVTLITDLNLKPDQLLAQMHQKTRYNIRLSDKHGVKVQVVDVSDQGLVKECINLFEQTSQRQGFKDFNSQYYHSLLDQLTDAGMVKLYRASWQNQTLAVAIMIDFAKTRTYLFGGSSDLHRNVMAPYALHWQAMQDARQNGLTKYDWWGLETATGKTSGFAQFKLRFGGNQVAYPPAFDIINKQGWYTIYNVLRKINRWL